jgi:uncharacterized protein
VCIASNQKIIIAAIASSAYVKAAVEAGFDVVAIDVFADVDTQRLATHCYQIELSNNQLDAKQLISVLDSMDLEQFVGFCYGAGFEKTPAVLTQINERITVFGNTSEVVNRCKKVNYFFNLCDRLGVPHPSVKTERPLHSNGWIQKEIGGSGGGHIQQYFDKQIAAKENVYYQQVQTGKSVSCLFLANETGIQVIGFSEQWLAELPEAPFSYGGAVSHADINEQAKVRLKEYVANLSQSIGLLGLNSCDAICDGDNIYVLEINPRLSATISLYTHEMHDLFAKHVAACQHDLDANLMQFNRKHKNSYAHQVIYAKQDVKVKSDLNWPPWVCDLPRVGSRLMIGSPLCTVFAEAETPSQAKSLVHARAAEMYRKFIS